MVCNSQTFTHRYSYCFHYCFVLFGLTPNPHGLNNGGTLCNKHTSPRQVFTELVDGIPHRQYMCQS